VMLLEIAAAISAQIAACLVSIAAAHDREVIRPIGTEACESRGNLSAGAHSRHLGPIRDGAAGYDEVSEPVQS